MALYRVEMGGSGFPYLVIADSFDEAETSVIEYLNKHDVGFIADRKAILIELIGVNLEGSVFRAGGNV